MCDILCFSQNVCFVRHIQLHTPNLVTTLAFHTFVLYFSIYTHLHAFYPLILTFFHFNDFHTGKLPVDTPVPARYNKHINSTEHTNAQC